MPAIDYRAARAQLAAGRGARSGRLRAAPPARSATAWAVSAARLAARRAGRSRPTWARTPGTALAAAPAATPSTCGPPTHASRCTRPSSICAHAWAASALANQ